ncbi:hypothetical protein JHK82_025619 [Glycine max]|uniref:TF-B3 domain-containing protein n=1 Tax=Glycine max TaxID=3847 RepID=A0A0R0IAI7_SOYBN|nr:hypothetical protein JHK85_026237 [Glycine max]KAG5013485.1 hypothetical protein JHK86_025746 [Glycine max]KAG5134431.1 hypothetical protein JHK82_025619 [Glycine max]KAH1043779.1 hypothetical protein GYH30_025563 [Glycine max]KAH1234317.1 hypothetical protein GmHk_09G026550 [Glycine max]
MTENSSSNSGKGKNIIDEQQHEESGKSEEGNNNRLVNEILSYNESQLKFLLNVGIVKDCELSMPYITQLTSDKWNLFLRTPQFEGIFLGFLKEGEDVRDGIPVNVYDKHGHEFEMMLKKFHKGSISYYVLNRGWLSFCNQQHLGENDIIALRTFRHAITDKLSFVVTYSNLVEFGRI